MQAGTGRQTRTTTKGEVWTKTRQRLDEAEAKTKIKTKTKNDQDIAKQHTT